MTFLFKILCSEAIKECDYLTVFSGQKLFTSGGLVTFVIKKANHPIIFVEKTTGPYYTEETVVVLSRLSVSKKLCWYIRGDEGEDTGIFVTWGYEKARIIHSYDDLARVIQGAWRKFLQRKKAARIIREWWLAIYYREEGFRKARQRWECLLLKD